jgi:hypothetical protein
MHQLTKEQQQQIIQLAKEALLMSLSSLEETFLVNFSFFNDF